MIATEEQSLKKLFILSIIRSAFFVVLILVLLLLHLYPVSKGSDVYVLLLFSSIYVLINIKYFQRQIQLWKQVPRFRFISWYYISFSAVWMVVLAALTIVAYFVFHDINLFLVALIVLLIELIGFYNIYRYTLHFININPDYIMIVKKQMKIITPKDIHEVYYRNDILIFKLLNEKTIFINFLEISNASEVRKQIAQWLQQNNIMCDEIIDQLLSYS